MQIIRNTIHKKTENPDSVDELLNKSQGELKDYYSLKKDNGVSSIKIDPLAIHKMIQKAGSNCVLYRGDCTWEDCFNYVKIRDDLEFELNRYVDEFERDFREYSIESIREGILFIIFLTFLIKDLIVKRLESVQSDEISSFESLITELTHVHVTKSYKPHISPESLSRDTKNILTFFGGIPPIRDE